MKGTSEKLPCRKCQEQTLALAYIGKSSRIRIPYRYCLKCDKIYKVKLTEEKFD